MSSSQDGSSTTENPVRDLKSALARAKDRLTDHADVVVELKASETGRLDILAQELRPVFDGVDENDERFEFALSKGERPRLWIDMTSFVAMGADKRSYRFLKDTRMGRIVLAETSDMQKTADIVSDYIAEKVLERERVLEGEWVSLRTNVERANKDNAQEVENAEQASQTALSSKAQSQPATLAASTQVQEIASAEMQVQPVKRKGSFWKGLFWFLFGAVACIAGFIIAALLLVPDAL